MRSLLFRSYDEQRDEYLIAALWEHGTSGVIEDLAGIRAFFDAWRDLTEIKTQWSEELIEERHEPVASSDRPSLEGWDGICVGQRFFLAPPWVTEWPTDGRMRITVDGGAAFGTGRHETTQMMIERLECMLHGGETVIDVGCGSGVLCEVARVLGAQTVIGCDIDPLAVAAVASNFGVAVFAGSADAIAAESADVLLVNISGRVIDALAGELRRIAKADAVVLLAGFVAQSPPTCFQPESSIERNEWLCWTGTRDGFSPRKAVSALTHSKHWW